MKKKLENNTNIPHTLERTRVKITKTAVQTFQALGIRTKITVSHHVKT